MRIIFLVLVFLFLLLLFFAWLYYKKRGEGEEKRGVGKEGKEGKEGRKEKREGRKGKEERKEEKEEEREEKEEEEGEKEEEEREEEEDGKKLPGDTCLISAECPSGYFCFNELCTRNPTSLEEVLNTAANAGIVCLDSHLLHLTKSGRFGILPGWWAVKEVIDICDSEVEGFVYLLTRSAIYWLPTYKPIGQPIKISASSVTTTEGGMSQMKRLFVYRNYLTCLTEEGKLYRGFNLRHGHAQPSWYWETIDFLAGRDLSSDTILYVAISNDGLISLTLQDGRRLVHLNGWTEEGSSNLTTRKIIFSDYRTTSLYLSGDRASLYLYDDTLLYSIDRIVDATIDPLVPSSIIAIKSTGPKRYRFVYQENDFIPEDAKRLHLYSVVEEPLIGSGHQLLTTARDAWMIANPECVRI